MKHPNIFEFIRENLSEFDTSNFQEDNPYNIPRVNATVVLKMKSECADIPIQEFLALRAKQYFVQTVDGKLIKKAKGVKRSVVERNITIDDYKNILFHETIKNTGNNTIQRPRVTHNQQTKNCPPILG